VTSVYNPESEPAESALAPPRRPRALAWTSVVLSVGLVLASVVLVDARQVLQRLEETDPRWLVAFFSLHVLQIVLLGLRWSTISRALAVPLSWRRASAEYSLSILVNQLLPTGIAGDGLRALRHSRRASGLPFARIIEALALDRLSGQLGLFMVVLASAPWSFRQGLVDAKSAAAVAAGLLGLVLLLVYLAREGGPARKLRAFLQRTRGALLSPRRAAIHLPISLLLIVTLLAQFYFAARAIGVDLDARLLFWLGPLVLLAASVPSFFGGWGIREGASAILFASVGFGSSTGVAVSLLFGAFALVCALPGFIVLLFEGQFSRRRWARAGGEVSWGNAHAVAMLSGTAMALALRIPALLTFVGVLSLLFLIVQSRGTWTPSGQFGFANAVTTLRLLLTLALLVGVDQQPPQVPAFTALAILSLDLVDGWLARRFAGESRFGACYDMEVDAVFVLSLSCTLWARGVSGLWVLVAGLWRYLFVVVPLIVPSRGGEAPRSIYYRFAYAVMVVSFVLALVVPAELGGLLGALGTAVVSASFLRSFYYRYSPPQVA
jgi:uncharacterized membrane protein YbhN (UPF0104 family)/phosphatidylglycerophosphate synthase